MVRLDRERLKAERKKRGLTLEKIAFESDDAFSSSTYKRAEGGQEISILMAQEIAAFLGAELDELLAKAVAEEVAAAEPAAPAEAGPVAEEPPPAVEAEPVVEEPPPDVGPAPRRQNSRHRSPCH
jgi:transcriptional regulator with XRE-family HTH domain